MNKYQLLVKNPINRRKESAPIIQSPHGKKVINNVIGDSN
jgi:hypothetical protein